MILVSDVPSSLDVGSDANAIQPWWKRRWLNWWQEQVLLLKANSIEGRWVCRVDDTNCHLQIWLGQIDTAVGPRQVLIQWGPGTPWIPPTLYPIEHLSCIHQYRDGAMCLLAPHGPENGWGGVPDITFWLKRAREWFEAFERQSWRVPPALWALSAAERPLPGYRTGVSSAKVVLLPPEWEHSIPPRAGAFELFAPQQPGRPWVMWRWRPDLDDQWHEWSAAQDLVSRPMNTVPGVWTFFDYQAIMDTGGLHPFRRDSHSQRFKSLLDRISKISQRHGTPYVVASRVREQGKAVGPWNFVLHATSDAMELQGLQESDMDSLNPFDSLFRAVCKATYIGFVLDPRRLASRRNAGKEDSLKQQMRSAHVCLVGCGALGSEVAHLLAQEGIEQFTLIDGDILLPENVARHRCDLSDVGRSKAEAIRSAILRINPQAKVDIYAQFVDEVLQHMRLKPRQHSVGGNESAESEGVAVSLVMGMTGDEASEGLLSDICSAAGVPTLQGWLEMKGQVLRLFRCLPGQDPSILELQTSPKSPIPSLPRSLEDNLPTQCAELVLPGSPLAIHSAANFVAQQVVRILSGGRSELNHWLFAPMGVQHPALAPELAALSQPYGSVSLRLEPSA